MEPHCESCDSGGSEKIERRSLLWLVVGGVAAWLWPRGALARKIAIRLARVPKLKKVGAFVMLRVAGRELLFMRSGPKSVQVVPAHCTHKHSKLSYDHGKGVIVCPNHGSRFTLAGKVLKGPAERKLAPLKAKLDAAAERILLDL